MVINLNNESIHCNNIFQTLHFYSFYFQLIADLPLPEGDIPESGSLADDHSDSKPQQ